MPGMDRADPERTETSRGLVLDPNPLPPDLGHPAQVGAFAAQELFVLSVAFFKIEYEFFSGHGRFLLAGNSRGSARIG
jgi:hypothetical protein